MAAFIADDVSGWSWPEDVVARLRAKGEEVACDPRGPRGSPGPVGARGSLAAFSAEGPVLLAMLPQPKLVSEWSSVIGYDAAYGEAHARETLAEMRERYVAAGGSLIGDALRGAGAAGASVVVIDEASEVPASWWAIEDVPAAEPHRAD